MATRRRRARGTASKEPASDFARASRHVVDGDSKKKSKGKAGKKQKRTTMSVAGISDEPAMKRAMDLAVKLGRAQAEWIIDRRQQRREKRAKTTARSAKGGRKRGAKTARQDCRRGPGPTSFWEGILVRLPFYDILKILEDDFASTSKRSRIAATPSSGMAYDGGQLEDFERTIERVIRRGQQPRAILLSGGGNDIAGDGFAMLLDHRSSPTHGLNAAVLAGVIETRIAVAYATILSAVTELCTRLLGHPVPILLHGYDYPVPDGRGFGFRRLPDPSRAGFREKRLLRTAGAYRYREILTIVQRALAALRRSGLRACEADRLRARSQRPVSYQNSGVTSCTRPRMVSIARKLFGFAHA